MLSIVIPVRNEGSRIVNLLNNLSNFPVEIKIIMVLNGCTDNTLQKVCSQQLPNLSLMYFRESLGLDIPRAVGAAYAISQNASTVLFLDGDMTENLNSHLLQLADAAEHGTDLALTNCYPRINKRSRTVEQVISIREELNRKLGLFSHLGVASPSHGPHACSRKLLSEISIRELAIPPVMQVLAVQNKLKIDVAAAISHASLGSAYRAAKHSSLIASTIIGDYAEAISLLENKERSRIWQGELFLGYHHLRRFDLLAQTLSGKKPVPIWQPGKTVRKLAWWFGEMWDNYH